MFIAPESSKDFPAKNDSVKAWFLAARPRTLPVSLPPIVVGTALAAGEVENLNWILAICALLSSLGIQIGTNLVNDAIDFKKGADGEGRLGPKRMTQEGLLSYSQVMAAGFFCFAFAFVCGIPLMFAGGWPLATILVVSAACGYLYTGGPWPLAYTGISDVFILIFFGWVSTGAVYFLQTGRVDFSAFVAGTQIGFLAIVPHAINNLRDRMTDGRVHKRTIAVRFGAHFARLEITLLSLLPFVLGLWWINSGLLWMAILPFFTLPAIIRNLYSIWETEPSTQYNQFLAKSALCQLFFGILLAVGALIPQNLSRISGIFSF